MTEQVSFYFDVSCPYCWVTSRWMKEVEQVRDVAVTWLPMSLSVLNEGRDLPADYQYMMDCNWTPARLFTVVQLEDGAAAVDKLYTALGTRIHTEDRLDRHARFDDPSAAFDELITEALAEVGLPAQRLAQAHTRAFDDQLRANQKQAMDGVGDEVGTPVVKLGDIAFFGPVITRIPRGEAAGELFDAAVELAKYPYFFELKRSRTESPQFD